MKKYQVFVTILTNAPEPTIKLALLRVSHAIESTFADGTYTVERPNCLGALFCCIASMSYGKPSRALAAVREALQSDGVLFLSLAVLPADEWRPGSVDAGIVPRSRSYSAYRTQPGGA